MSASCQKGVLALGAPPPSPSILYLSLSPLLLSLRILRTRAEVSVSCQQKGVACIRNPITLSLHLSSLSLISLYICLLILFQIARTRADLSVS